MIVRFLEGGPHWGRIVGDTVHVLSSAPWAGGRNTGEVRPLSALHLLAPCTPSKVVCAARNYAAHAAELGNAVPQGEPLFFLKPSTSVIGPGEAIVRPRASENVQHEAELGIVIGALCKDVSPEDVPDKVFGFTCVNDVTARDLQQRDKHFTRSKGFDTFCPVGPWIAEGFTAEDRAVRCRVNGELRQDGTTAQLVFRIPELIAHLSSVMTLLPGDVIATGTPAGVGPLVAGDVVEVEVEGVGVLRNTVRDQGAPQ